MTKFNYDLLRKTEYYLFKFVFDRNETIIKLVSPQTLQASSFLDTRIKHVKQEIIVPTADLLNHFKDNSIRSTGNQYHIFHTAYCCSTLLSRILDYTTKTTVYREPITTHQVAVMQRRKHLVPPQIMLGWDNYLSLCLSSLSKTWDTNEVPIIKHSDSVNNIIPRLLSTSSSKAILLYSSLDEFLISNLKSTGRRNFLQNFVARSRLDQANGSSLSNIDTETLSIARQAAYVWATQISKYNKVLQSTAEQCRALDSKDLLNNKKKTLESINNFFDLKLNKPDIEIILNSTAWSTHAKSQDDAKFTLKNREIEKVKIYKQYKKEIDDATNWLKSICDTSDERLKSHQL